MRLTTKGRLPNMATNLSGRELMIKVFEHLKSQHERLLILSNMVEALEKALRNAGGDQMVKEVHKQKMQLLEIKFPYKASAFEEFDQIIQKLKDQKD